MKAAILGIILALGSAACGGTEVRGALDTGKPAADTVEADAPTQTEFSVGEKAQTQAGNIVVLHAYEAPVVEEDFPPDPGFEYGAIDVEGCAGGSAPGSSFGLNPFDFTLQMPDNTRLTSTLAWKEPSLSDTKMTAGDCARGWITFEVPVGQRPAFAVYSGTSVIKFRIP